MKTVGEMAQGAFEILDDCLYTLFSNQTYDDKWTSEIREKYMREFMSCIANYYLQKHEEYKDYV